MSWARRLGPGLIVASGVMVRGAAAFALTKACAAILGPVEFARYGHFLMLASYLVTASSVGLGNALTVYLGRRSSEPGSDLARDGAAVAVVGGATGAFAGFALTLTVVANGTGGILPRIGWLDLPAWISFCVAAGLGGAYLASLLAAQRHLAYQALSAAIPLVAIGGLGLFHCAVGLSADRAILSYMAGYGVPAFAFFIWRPALRKVTRASLTAIARFALPYVLPSLLVPTIAAISVLAIRRIVALYSSPIDLGLWQALWRLSESYMGVLVAILIALFIPRLARAKTRGEATRLVLRTCALACALYLPIGLAWLLAPRLALSLLLSRSFLGIESLLPMQAVGDLLKVVCTVLILTCTALLRPGLTLLAEVVLNGGFLGLALLLTPRAGAAGAVTAYACAYALLLMVLAGVVRGILRRMPKTFDLEPSATSPVKAGSGSRGEMPDHEPMQEQNRCGLE